MSNILFLDTETTGVDSDKNEVIEIACQYYQNDKLHSEFQTKMQLSWKKDISMGALRVNRCDVENNDLPYREEAAAKFVKYLVSLPGDRQNPITVGGHNVAFDIVGLKKFLAGEGYSGWGDIFSYNQVDTATICNFLRVAGIIKMDRLSLANLAKALEIEVDKTKTHGAMYDTQLTVACYFKMLKMLKELELDANNYKVITSIKD